MQINTTTDVMQAAEAMQQGEGQRISQHNLSVLGTALRARKSSFLSKTGF
jgi:hypothetical protein